MRKHPVAAVVQHVGGPAAGVHVGEVWRKRCFSVVEVAISAAVRVLILRNRFAGPPPPRPPVHHPIGFNHARSSNVQAAGIISSTFAATVLASGLRAIVIGSSAGFLCPSRPIVWRFGGGGR